jgi:hypothetical protein
MYSKLTQAPSCGHPDARRGRRAEFQRLYRRCREDTAGTEPRGLFEVAEFVMRDRAGAGEISLEEAMQITYLRHGRAQLDAKLEEVFGTSDLNSGKTLGLSEFLACLHTNQVRALLGRVAAGRGGCRVPSAGAGGAAPTGVGGEAVAGGTRGS